MAFRLRCPKCDSPNIYVEKDRSNGWGNPLPVLHCQCGKMIYGKENIQALQQSQHRAWQAGAAARAAKEAAYKKEIEEKQRAGRSLEKVIRRQRREKLAARAAAEEARRLDNIRWMSQHQGHKHAERGTQSAAPTPPTPARTPAPAVRGKTSFPCTFCGAMVWKRPFEVKRNKTGHFFCSPAHHKAWLVASGGPFKAAPEQTTSHRTDGPTCDWKECENPPAKNSRYCSVQCRNRKARHGYKERAKLKRARRSEQPGTPPQPPE
jgi:hypothetical protein